MKWSVGTASLYYIVRGIGYGVGIGALFALFLRIVAPFDPIGDTVGSVIAALAPGFAEQQALLRAQLGLPTSQALNILPLLPQLIGLGMTLFLVACLGIVIGRRRQQQRIVRLASTVVMIGTLLVVASFFYLLTGFWG